jgi:hypothetical protein
MKLWKLFFILCIISQVNSVLALGQWAEHIDKQDLNAARLYACKKWNQYTRARQLIDQHNEFYTLKQSSTYEPSILFLCNFLDKKVNSWFNRQYNLLKKKESLLPPKKNIEELLRSVPDQLKYDEWETLIDYFSKNQEEKLNRFIVNQHLNEIKNISLFKNKPEKSKILDILQDSLGTTSIQRRDHQFYALLQEKIDSRICFRRESFNLNSPYYKARIEPLAQEFGIFHALQPRCILIDNDFMLPSLVRQNHSIGHGVLMGSTIKAMSPSANIEEISDDNLGNLSNIFKEKQYQTEDFNSQRAFLNFSIDAPYRRSLFWYSYNTREYVISLRNVLNNLEVFQEFRAFLNQPTTSEVPLETLVWINEIAEGLENKTPLPSNKNSFSGNWEEYSIVASFSERLIHQFTKSGRGNLVAYQKDIRRFLKDEYSVAFFAAGNDGFTLEKQNYSGTTLSLAEDPDIEDASLIIGNLRVTPRFSLFDLGDRTMTSNYPGYYYQRTYVLVPGDFSAYLFENGALYFLKDGGTSTATARMTGIGAALREQFPWLNPNVIRWAVLITANRNFENYNPYYHGQGIVDVEAAQEFCIAFSQSVLKLTPKVLGFLQCCIQTTLLNILKENWTYSNQHRPSSWINAKSEEMTIEAINGAFQK